MFGFESLLGYDEPKKPYGIMDIMRRAAITGINLRKQDPTYNPKAHRKELMASAERELQAEHGMIPHPLPRPAEAQRSGITEVRRRRKRATQTLFTSRWLGEPTVLSRGLGVG